MTLDAHRTDELGTVARVGPVFVGRREDQGADGRSSATTGSTVRDWRPLPSPSPSSTPSPEPVGYLARRPRPRSIARSHGSVPTYTCVAGALYLYYY